MLKDKLLCNLKEKLILPQNKKVLKQAFADTENAGRLISFKSTRRGSSSRLFETAILTKFFENTTWLVNLPIKPTLRLNKIVYTHTHTQCIGQIAAQQVGDELSWLEGSTYSTDNQDISQQHSLPQSDWICACNKNEMFLDNPPFVPPVNLTSTSHESTHTHPSGWAHPIYQWQIKV